MIVITRPLKRLQAQWSNREGIMFESRLVKQAEERDTVLTSREINNPLSAGKFAKITHNRISGCRYELKYHVTESKAAAIVEFIKPFMHLDKYCMRQKNGYYPNVSLYLDSEDLQLCWESLTGEKNRFKLRIRSYTDELDYPRFVEIKRRMNSIIIKSRAKIMDSDIPALLSGHSVLFQRDINANETINQFQLYMKSIQARPLILVRYLRQAYKDNFHNNLRITFDRELVYKVTNLPEVRLGGRGWYPNSFSIGGVVLEIKFNNHYPEWLTRMARYFNLQQRSISKYVSSIQESCLLKFCAPQLEHIDG